MKILKTMLTFTDNQLGFIFLYDTIEYHGKFWIVPEWILNRALKKRRPARIILLDGLRHQRIDRESDPHSEADFYVNDPIPKSVLDGHPSIETKDQFCVLENPEIFDDIPELIQ